MAKKKPVKAARKKVAAARKNVIKKVGGAAKKVGKATAKTAKKAGAQLKKVANAGGTAALLPFVLVMNKAIKNNGETPEKDLLKKAKQFQRLVINKNFQDKDNFGFDTSEYFEENNLVDDIASIVKDVVDFIKKLDAKKKNGTATPEELEELDAAEKGIEEETKRATAEGIGETVSNALQNPVTIIFGLLIASLIGYAIYNR